MAGTNPNTPIYPDETASCNFSSQEDAKKKYRQCYLYATNSVGDQYEISYYSEATQNFLVFRKVQDLPLQRIR